MASAMYPSWKAKLLASTHVTMDSETEYRLLLIDVADYTYSAAHDFLDDVAAASREEGPVTLTTTTIALGVFDALDVVFVGATGDPCEALIIYAEGGGTDATRDLVVYIDGFSVTPNSGDITVAWDNGASKIFAL